MRKSVAHAFSSRWLPAALMLALWLFLPGDAPNSDGLNTDIPNAGSIGLRKDDAVRWLPLFWVCWRSVNWTGGRLRSRASIFSVNWHWVDVPVVIYCLCPLFGGLVNSHPIEHAVWETAKEFSYWFIPYLIGRTLANHAANTRGLAWVIVLSAAIYAPLALTEVFTGPIFTEWVTGVRPGGQWNGAVRGSTFRPSVFLPDGFVLTMYFVLAAMAACTLAWQYVLEPIRQRWLWAAMVLFIAVVFASKSLGSIVLLSAGLSFLATIRWAIQVAVETRYIQRLRWLVVALACSAPIYMWLRIENAMKTVTVHEMATQLVSTERAGSLAYRMQAEDIVFEQMAEHWMFGYGDFGLWQQDRENVRALDGFWLFTLTRTGLVSVVAWLGMILVPLILWAQSRPLHRSQAWRIDCDWIWAICLALHLVDSMFNYFGQAPQMLLVGVLTSVNRYHARTHA